MRCRRPARSPTMGAPRQEMSSGSGRRYSRCSLIVRRLQGLLASNPGDALRAPSGTWRQPFLRAPSSIRRGLRRSDIGTVRKHHGPFGTSRPAIEDRCAALLVLHPSLASKHVLLGRGPSSRVVSGDPGVGKTDAERHFLESIDHLKQSRVVTSLARATLLYGEWLPAPRISPSRRSHARAHEPVVAGIFQAQVLCATTADLAPCCRSGHRRPPPGRAVS
jgi:hypothetical protein